MAHKPLVRVFSIVLSVICLVSCFVLPASAMGSWIGLDAPRQFYPDVGYRVYSRIDYRDWTPEGEHSETLIVEDSWRGTDRIDPYAKDTADGWPGYYQSFSTRANSSLYNEFTTDIWIQGYEKFSEVVVDGNPLYRIHEGFEINRRSVSGDGVTSYINEPAYYKIVLDDFGGAYDRSYLNTLFYVEGRYRYQVAGTFFTIKANKLVTLPFVFEVFNSNGQQSIITQNYLNFFEKYSSVANGDPYFISNLTVNFLDQTQALKVSRLANEEIAPVSYFHSDYPIYGTGYTLKEFLTQHGLLTGPSASFLAGEDITDFIGGAATSVFDAKLFGDFSLGSVLTTMFIVAVVFWLLKVFAGG